MTRPVRIIHPAPDENDDYGCGAHVHTDHPTAGVVEWQQRHGGQNPVTGALHPKIDAIAMSTFQLPLRRHDKAVHERVYKVLRLLSEGKPVKASSRPVGHIDERLDPDFQSILRLVRSPEWRRAAKVQQLYPATKGTVRGPVANRQTHGIQAAWVAGTLALHMGLNPWRAVAASLAHDVGHTAFAHPGEEALDAVYKTITTGAAVTFGHSENGGQVVRRPHLAFEDLTADAIEVHSWSLRHGLTAEAALVSIADRIAYVCSDLRDVLTVGVLPWQYSMRAVPKVFQLAHVDAAEFESIGSRLGPAGIADRLMVALTKDVLHQFDASGEIGFTPFGASALNELRSFIPDQTFRTPKHQRWQQAQSAAAEFLIEDLAKEQAKLGFHGDEALLAAGAIFAEMDDATAYSQAAARGFSAAERLAQGPPTAPAKVTEIHRRGPKPKSVRMPDLGRALPPVSVVDASGRRHEITVPEALLAIRLAETMAPGAYRTMNASLAPEVDGVRHMVTVPGRETSEHERFVDSLREDIARVVELSLVEHKRLASRVKRSPQETLLHTAVSRLREVEVAVNDTSRPLIERLAAARDSRADLLIEGCAAYVKAMHANERRTEPRGVNFDIALESIA